MTEIYPEIPDNLRELADTAFSLATKMNPEAATDFLHNFTEYYSGAEPNEEIRDFLHFYFNLKLEELKS